MTVAPARGQTVWGLGDLGGHAYAVSDTVAGTLLATGHGSILLVSARDFDL